MFDIFCRCPKCGNGMNIDFDSTILAYYKEFSSLNAIYPSTDPPKFPEYVIMKCYDVSCKHINKHSHLEVLKMMSEFWAKIAWSFAVSNHANAFNFEDKFTRYINLKGLNKIVTSSEIDQNKILKEFYEFSEKESTEESND